jgi:hypothetical protein
MRFVPWPITIAKSRDTIAKSRDTIEKSRDRLELVAGRAMQ